MFHVKHIVYHIGIECKWEFENVCMQAYTRVCIQKQQKQQQQQQKLIYSFQAANESFCMASLIEF